MSSATSSYRSAPSAIGYRLGLALVVSSAAGSGCGPVFARMAYQDGGAATLVLVARGLAGAALVGLACLWLGRPLRLARSGIKAALGLGLLLFAMSAALLAAVEVLPANLVLLIYFLHLLFVAAVVPRAGGQSRLAALAGPASAALLGQAVVLGVDVAHLQPLGVMLAVTAASLCGVMVAGGSIAARRWEPLALTFHMTLVALVLALPALRFAALSFPHSPYGWAGVVGAAFSFALSMGAFFIASPAVGAVKASFITNVAPVFGLVASFLVLHETLTPLQLAGAALVIGSVLAVCAKREET